MTTSYKYFDVKHNYYLAVKNTHRNIWVVGTSFWAPNDEAAGKIARVTVKTWVAATKHREADQVIKRENVTLHKYPKEIPTK